MAATMGSAVSAFGASVKSKLASLAVVGAPEDQLRAPFETLIRDLDEPFGLLKNGAVLIGEARNEATRTRPDYTVSLRNGAIGFVELKAPGKGADPRLFKDAHDKAQWDKLKALPNLLYTDGQSFSLWRDGLQVDRVVSFKGAIRYAGRALKAPDALRPLLQDFFGWRPTPPETAKQLASVSARLCRYLRDQVFERLTTGSTRLKDLQAEWRKLLFPEASDAVFADSYAQAVIFGLLLARVHDIPLGEGLDQAVSRLRKTDSFIGSALRLLIDDETVMSSLEDAIKVIITIFETVSWAQISKEKQDVWLYFYEDFLEAYDPKLRRSTGSYYTPFEVVSAMVRMVDQVLRGPLFERPLGLASPDVTTLDPACGTGTFILGILRSIADTVREEQGGGAVPGAISAALDRIMGFEIQFGPFSVAQLRIVAEIQHLAATGVKAAKLPLPRLSLTDTLDNPYVEEEQLSFMTDPVAKSRRDANRIKRDTPITVVLGNPPYKEKAEGRGSWIEKGSTGSKVLKAPLDWWRPPAAWAVGAHTKHLRNMYVYFWRWAAWKVFGSGWHPSTGLPDVDRSGIVCFVSVAGFLNGPGFQRMRDDLRRSCSDIWVVDCSPDGHQPEVSTRIFGGVQQPVCIVLAARKLGKAADEPARVHFRALPKGRRENKLNTLAELSIGDTGWIEGAIGWRDPFLPKSEGFWEQLPALRDLFPYDGSGVMPGRTWVIAPDRQSLEMRWKRLKQERTTALRAELFYPHQDGDRTINKKCQIGLPQHEFRSESVDSDVKDVVKPVNYAFRTLDRQWIIPDARLLNRPNPHLWRSSSQQQIYLTALEAHAPSSGAALSITALIPDIHHYKGSFGGRVYPLWQDAGATQPNLRSELINFLTDAYAAEIRFQDILAYIAAVMAHPGFTSRFASNLVRPGLRLPLTADRALFSEAVALGREVVWLHCYGERFADTKAGRPKGAPRLPKDERPIIPAQGAIPGAPEPLPDLMTYDAGERRLRIGAGYVDRVTPAMWAYEVSGKNVLRQWFSYRRRDRTKPVIGDRRPPSELDRIQPDHWPAEYTSDLVDLLNVLGRLVKLEPAQADLLARICDGPLVSADVLLKAGAIVPKPGSDA